MFSFEGGLTSACSCRRWSARGPCQVGLPEATLWNHLH